MLQEFVTAQGTEAIICKHWASGSAGILPLAEKVINLIDAGSAEFRPLYPDDFGLREKVETVAKQIYRAGDVTMPQLVLDKLQDWEQAGYGHLPICIAKTPYSFSADKNLRGAPDGFTLNVRNVRLSAGAGFVVVLCGDVMTMPGLPRTPSAEAIELDRDGEIIGLF